MTPENTHGSAAHQPVSGGGDSALAHLSVFNKNRHFLFIYKKTEKLVTAVYMITNFIKDSEPLKWRLRERALELMSLNMSFNTVSLSERKELLREYQAISIEIVSLTSIAYHSGLISEMNWAILKKEFEALVDTIERGENRQANEETVIISPEFFSAPMLSPEPIRPTASPVMPTVSPARPQSIVSKGQASITVRKEKLVSLSERPASIINQKDSVSSTPAPKDDRRSVIMSVLSKRDGLSVKDFVDALKGVSEKTIQRELLAMVASGTLRKEGERRWSRYFLPTSA